MLKRAAMIVGAVLLLTFATMAGATATGAQEYPPADEGVLDTSATSDPSGPISGAGTQGEALARTGQDGLGDLARVGVALVALGALTVIAVTAVRRRSADAAPPVA